MMKFKKVRLDKGCFFSRFFDFSFSFAADLISTIEFNEDGELLAVGDKGGRIVVFQREPLVKKTQKNRHWICIVFVFR